MVPLRFITGSVHKDAHDLIALLCAETERLGYSIRRDWSWGYHNRPIAGTSTPSNHSWGLAVDLNAPVNPMRRPLTTDIPMSVVRLWESYGFRWGGRYTGTPDPMHFEFMGTPEEAAAFTQRARRELGGGTTTTSEEEDEMKRGDSGAAVTLIQNCLENWNRTRPRPAKGGLLPEHGADGQFGAETEAAVRTYQRAAGRPDTGRVDGLTGALILRFEKR